MYRGEDSKKARRKFHRKNSFYKLELTKRTKTRNYGTHTHQYTHVEIPAYQLQLARHALCEQRSDMSLFEESCPLSIEDPFRSGLAFDS